MKHLIYISGSGRSGSTLLERILNSSDDFFALGEFHCLWRLPADQITCSCGAPFATDPFWRDILDRARITERELAKLRRLEQEISRTPFLARCGYRLETVRNDDRVRQFLALQFRIFEAISAVTGASVIVDSSKAGPRAWLLACDPRTRLLHLYRDPGDVIASWRSAKFDRGLNSDMQRLTVRQAAVDWGKVEFLMQKLSLQTQVEKMDYGRLCEAPAPCVEAALQKLVDEGVRPCRWLDGQSFMPGSDYHSLNGNPDRFATGPVRIAPRAADRSRLPFGERTLIAVAHRTLKFCYPSP